MSTPCEETAVEVKTETPSVSIRKFHPGDEASFKTLNEEWIVRHFVLEDKDRAVLGDPMKYILDPGGEIIFAVIGAEIVGCCALAPEGPGHYEVAKMAVTEAHQGKGIGRKILERVIAEARAKGATRLYLETSSKLTATFLYESIGFRHLSVEERQPSLYSRADVFMEMML
jgi:putative acetyltransferase